MAVLEAHRLPFDNISHPRLDTHPYSGRHWSEKLLRNAMNPSVGGFSSGTSDVSIPPSAGTVQEGLASGKKRKSGKPKPMGELRRVASTPQIRGISMNEHIPPSPTAADKRRSKLGYHRSSVACTHCRKRKIRCVLPIPPDPQGRCSHCIRLKKECKFEGVNESSPIDPKAKRSGPPSISDPSSPQASSHASGIQEEPEQAYHPESQVNTGFNGAPIYHDPERRYGYPQPVGAEAWSQDGITSPTASATYQREDPHSPYWSPTQATHPASFHQANAGAAMSNAGAYAQPVYAPQAGPSGWSTQQRSMSLGQSEHIQQPYPYQEVAPYDQQHPDPRGQYPAMGHAMGLPPPPQMTQQYAYQPSEWQRYEIAGGEPSARDRSTYEYPAQYYAGQQPSSREGMPPPTIPYRNASAYYPPATQQG